MEMIAQFVIGIFELLIELSKIFWKGFSKAAIFFLWLISGAIILPCVYMAAVWFPKWNDWGDKL